MAQFVVRNIENGVKDRLQRRARRNGHSMEEEVRDILRNAVLEATIGDTMRPWQDALAAFLSTTSHPAS